MNTEESIKCPVCGKGYGTLLRHVRTHIPAIMDKDDFYKEFPDFKGKLHLDRRKVSECKCEVCGKVYRYKNILALHYKNKHPEYYASVVNIDRRKNAVLVCPVCEGNYSDIKQHVEGGHRITWEDFCRTYGWDLKNTKVITEEYRKNLSENKSKFYNETERGAELRIQQSEAWKTDANPSKMPEIKRKMMYSRAVNGRWTHNNNKRCPLITYKGITFGSVTEFQCFVLCEYLKIPVVYEPGDYAVCFYNEEKNFVTTYLPDFLIDGRYLIELKPTAASVRFADKSKKYARVREIYKAKKVDYRIGEVADVMSFLGIFNNKIEMERVTREIVLDGLEKDRICIICNAASTSVKKLTGLGDLTQKKNIIII